ncbi:MAG: TetR/AcrR family transcriptional regulator [Clostridiales bacterium]|nr:TetR/AcrR family transcriptional regulator [Clostridiales bacterium]
MAEEKAPQNVHDRLIIAGLEELNKHGIQNFSVRRIASACGVSCAAPYKHFTDKQDFIAAIIHYCNSQWKIRQRKIVDLYPAPRRKQILEISLEYIRFLVENPHFRSILMMKDAQLDNEYAVLRGKMSRLAIRLIRRYCKEVGMSEQTAMVKTYIVRSLIYGAALMFDNGEMEYNDENMQAVALAIDREFDLPGLEN